MPSTWPSRQSAHVSVKRAGRTLTAPRGVAAAECTAAEEAAYVDEDHPTGPVVHRGSKVLLCGTFPPVKKSIRFYYPNASNDMWRILGELFFADQQHFYTEVPVPQVGTARRRSASRPARCLDEGRIRAFVADSPIGFCDVCQRVRRHRSNSSDDNLEALQRTDLFAHVLPLAPECEAIVTTGTLALTMLLDALQPRGAFSLAGGEAVVAVTVSRHGKPKYVLPAVGGKLRWTPSATEKGVKALWIYRAPSTSRALPMAYAVKCRHYREAMQSHVPLQSITAVTDSSAPFER